MLRRKMHHLPTPQQGALTEFNWDKSVLLFEYLEWQPCIWIWWLRKCWISKWHSEFFDQVSTILPQHVALTAFSNSSECKCLGNIQDKFSVFVVIKVFSKKGGSCGIVPRHTVTFWHSCPVPIVRQNLPFYTWQAKFFFWSVISKTAPTVGTYSYLTKCHCFF